MQEAALKAGYGPTIRADAVKKLVDSVVNYQERSREIIAEMRELSTKNAAEIRDAVETGKQRLARLVESGQALELVAHSVERLVRAGRARCERCHETRSSSKRRRPSTS